MFKKIIQNQKKHTQLFIITKNYHKHWNTFVLLKVTRAPCSLGGMLKFYSQNLITCGIVV